MVWYSRTVEDSTIRPGVFSSRMADRFSSEMSSMKVYVGRLEIPRRSNS